VVSLNITTSTDPVNFNVSYAYSTRSTDLSTNLTTNRSKFSSSFEHTLLDVGKTVYIYVICEIANLELDASFIGTANWELIDKNEFEGDYEVIGNYAEIKSGDYVRSAIMGSETIISSRLNQTVQTITFGSLSDYQSVISGITNDTEQDYMMSYDGGVNTIDISANNDNNVVVYRVANGGYYDVYILVTEPDAKIRFNTDSSEMFAKLCELNSINFANIVDTSRVTNMSCMFDMSSNLTTLDLSGWDISNVTDMSYMFDGCSGLTAIYVGSGWSTAKVTSGTDMFYNCTSLPNFNSSYTDHTYCSRYMTLV